MGTGKDSAKGKSSKLAVVMYVGAVVSAAIAIYMVVTSVNYINGYAASYGMGFGDMWADGIQYILTNSVSYIVYALVLLGLGKILDILQNGKAAEVAKSEEADKADEKPALSAGIITGEAEVQADVPEEKEAQTEAEEEIQNETDAEDKESEKKESEEKDV